MQNIKKVLHVLIQFLRLAQKVLVVKSLPANAGDIRDPEEGMAIHSGILAWRIPWTEEPGGLWSIRSQKVGHD